LVPVSAIEAADEARLFIRLSPIHDFKEYLNEQQHLNSVIATEILLPPTSGLTPNDALADVMPVLLASYSRKFPIMDDAANSWLVERCPASKRPGCYRRQSVRVWRPAAEDLSQKFLEYAVA